MSSSEGKRPLFPAMNRRAILVRPSDGEKIAQGFQAWDFLDDINPKMSVQTALNDRAHG